MKPSSAGDVSQCASKGHGPAGSGCTLAFLLLSLMVRANEKLSEMNLSAVQSASSP